MKVYQCLHCYASYIPLFEKKYQIKENDYTFAELVSLLVSDGFASCNILKPAFDENNQDFFYTLWDYQFLQFKWAEENGLKSRNLDEIKLAQIEHFKPDVFYNLSPLYDGNFVEKLNQKGLIKVCWDSVAKHVPDYHRYYDIRFSLFEPYVKFWKQHGLSAYILPPAFPDSWDLLDFNKKEIDVLFYGQTSDYFFSNRNKTLVKLIDWIKQENLKVQLHLQISNSRKSIIDLKGFRKLTKWIPSIPKEIKKNALEPIYGQDLYETIAKSKIVINTFGNFNGLYKYNMRNFETIGCGAFLISEDGIYPEDFNQNTDFYTYRNPSELFDKIEHTLSLPDQGRQVREKTRDKLKLIYSKEKQWENFTNAIASI